MVRSPDSRISCSPDSPARPVHCILTFKGVNLYPNQELTLYGGGVTNPSFMQGSFEAAGPTASTVFGNVDWNKSVATLSLTGVLASDGVTPATVKLANRCSAP